MSGPRRGHFGSGSPPGSGRHGAGRGEHPGMANYPSEERSYRPGEPRRPPTGGAENGEATNSGNRYLPPLGGDRRSAYRDTEVGQDGRGADDRPRVTRTAAEMGSRMYSMVHRAATADGADKSGLTALTWPVVANFAVDSAMAVALANTLFFAAATGESKGRVALYLLITIAPFAVIAPLIGPALDRLQHGRRAALAASFLVRTLLAVLLIINYDAGNYPSWVLYPCALGMMVMSKSFSVLRSAVTPRVMPPSIDLVRVNSRLTMFGLIGGTIVGGGIAAGVEYVFSRLLGLPGALFVVVFVTLAGASLTMRIPKWVEVTEGEVPTTLTYHGQGGEWDWLDEHPTEVIDTGERRRQPLGRNIITSLWGNCTIKAMVGFLFLYPAFVAKAHDASGWGQLAILGGIGAAAGVGNFAGNFTAARLRLGRPATVVVRCAVAVTAMALIAAVSGILVVAAAATLVTSAASAIGKASLDASLQDDLPEESRASAFGRSESMLQLAWVMGGAMGVLVYTELWVGFTAISSLLILGLAQTVVSYRGASLIPGFGGNRPVVAEPETLTVVLR